MNSTSRLLVVAVLLSLLACGVSAELLRVPQDYATIFEAGAEAVSGDTIGVYAGVYYEGGAHVNPGVTVLGMEDDSTLIQVYPASSSAPFLAPSGEEPAVIENLQIFGGLTGGVVTNHNPELVIQRCYLFRISDEWEPCFVIRSSADIVVRRCHILAYHHVDNALLIELSPDVRALMEDCIVYATAAVWLEGQSSCVELRNNTFLTGIRADNGHTTAWSMIVVNNILPYGRCVGSDPDTLEWRYNCFTESLPDPDCGYQIGNFSDDPLLCDTEIIDWPFARDYRLQPDSPCRGAGEGSLDVGARWGVCWPPEGLDDWPYSEIQRLRVSDPRPNPSMGEVRLLLEQAPSEPVQIRVWDVAGNLVRTLPTIHPNERQQVHWDGRTTSGQLVPAGIYYLRVATPTEQTSKRVVILK